MKKILSKIALTFLMLYSITSFSQVVILPITAPTGFNQYSYFYNITVEGAAAGQYTFAVTSGTFPRSLILQSGGKVTGNMSFYVDTSFAFIVTATNVANGATTAKNYTITTTNKKLTRKELYTIWSNTQRPKWADVYSTYNNSLDTITYPLDNPIDTTAWHKGGDLLADGVTDTIGGLGVNNNVSIIATAILSIGNGSSYTTIQSDNTIDLTAPDIGLTSTGVVDLLAVDAITITSSTGNVDIITTENTDDINIQGGGVNITSKGQNLELKAITNDDITIETTGGFIAVIGSDSVVIRTPDFYIDTDTTHFLGEENWILGDNIVFQGVTSFNVQETPEVLISGVDALQLDCENSTIEMTTTDGVSINSTTPIIAFLRNTVALDFPSIPANSTTTLTMTLTGGVVGDCIYIGIPASIIGTNLVVMGYVSSANTVTIQILNPTAGAVDLASSDFCVSLIK